MWEWWFSYTYSYTLHKVLSDGTHAPAAFPLRNFQCQLERRLARPQVVQNLRQIKNLCVVGNKTQIPWSSTVRSSQYINMSRFHVGQVMSSNLVQVNNPVI